MHLELCVRQAGWGCHLPPSRPAPSNPAAQPKSAANSSALLLGSNCMVPNRPYLGNTNSLCEGLQNVEDGNSLSAGATALRDGMQTYTGVASDGQAYLADILANAEYNDTIKVSVAAAVCSSRIGHQWQGGA